MCGIAGVVGAGAERPVRWPDLSHRGPDGRGEWRDGNAHFRHWRLRILDLTAASDQPFVSADGSAGLVYNGEIYNAAEIREELREAGALFRTRGDTEVVLQSLLARGPAGIERLRGMFAFAAWMGTPRRLFLARDAFGIKPLYFAVGSAGVRFASELPGLLGMLEVRPSPRLSALWEFFTFGFVPAPGTAFEGVFKVLPGQVLEFDEAGHLVSERRLRRPWLDRGASHRPDAPSVRQALISSVREQFEADVPVGLFLSGGVDSNVLLAAAQEAGLKNVKTFTIAFEDPLEGDSNDETGAARESARFFETDHTEISVRLGPAEELLEDLARFGEPFANPTVYLTRRLSHETRQHVTVALSGAGGDELFGGYPRYAALSMWRLLRGPLGKAAGRLAGGAAGLLGRRTPRAVRRISWAAGSGKAGLTRAYLEWTYYLREDEKERLFPGLSARGEDSIALIESPFTEGLASRGLVCAGPACDLATFLPENILAYTDVGSMAESLEVRVPFLDPDVAHGAMRSLRRRDLSFSKPKAALRRIFADRLPQHVLRQRKRGFNPPLAPWIRGPLDRFLTGGETKVFRREFLLEEELGRMRERHRTGAEDFAQELLSIVVAGMWYEKWR